jgi:hypothetical protein
MLTSLLGTAEYGIRLGVWGFGWGYYGINYLIYGKPVDPVVKRLNELEAKLEKKIKIEMNHLDDKSPDFIFFWEHKSQFKLGYWLVIRDQKVLVETIEKTVALKKLLEQNGEKTLLIFNDFKDEIIYQI